MASGGLIIAIVLVLVLVVIVVVMKTKSTSGTNSITTPTTPTSPTTPATPATPATPITPATPNTPWSPIAPPSKAATSMGGDSVVIPFRGWTGSSYVLDYATQAALGWNGAVSADTTPILCSGSLTSGNCAVDLTTAGLVCDAVNATKAGSCVGIIYNASDPNLPVAIPVASQPNGVAAGTAPSAGGGAIYLTLPTSQNAGNLQFTVDVEPNTTSYANALSGPVPTSGAVLDCVKRNLQSAGSCGGVFVEQNPWTSQTSSTSYDTTTTGNTPVTGQSALSLTYVAGNTTPSGIFYVDPTAQNADGYAVADAWSITCPNAPDCPAPSTTVWNNTVACPNSSSTTACITDYNTAAQLCSLNPNCVGILLNGGYDGLGDLVGGNGTTATFPLAQLLTSTPSTTATSLLYDTYWLPKDTTLATAPMGTFVPQLVDSPDLSALSNTGMISTSALQDCTPPWCQGLVDGGFGNSKKYSGHYIQPYVYGSTRSGGNPLTTATLTPGTSVLTNLGMQYTSVQQPLLAPFTGWTGNEYVIADNQPNQWMGVTSADTSPITCDGSQSSSQCMTDLVSAGTACDNAEGCIGIIYNISDPYNPISIPVNTQPTNVALGTSTTLGGGSVFLTTTDALQTGDGYWSLTNTPTTSIPNTVLSNNPIGSVNFNQYNPSFYACNKQNTSSPNTCGGVLFPDYASLYHQYSQHNFTPEAITHSSQELVPNGILYDTLNTGQTAATDYTNAIAFTHSTK